MSSTLSGMDARQVSKWVAPNVNSDQAFHELVSEDTLAKLREDARQAGHAEGMRAGLDQGKALVNTRLELLEKLIGHVSQPLDQLEAETLGAMVELSLQVASELIGRELLADQSLVLKAVSDAVSAVPGDAQNLKIALNPADLTVVQEAYKESTTMQNPLIVGDPAIERGGVIVESGTTLIDAQLTARLSSTLAALLDPAESV